MKVIFVKHKLPVMVAMRTWEGIFTFASTPASGNFI
jgi:hypothetical protein